MTDKLRFRLTHATARKMAKTAVMSAPDGWSVELRPPRRSDEQNEAMHAKLGDIAKQVTWCDAKLSVEDWKRVATAMLKKDKFVRDVGEDGQPGNGLIVVGARTRDMSSKDIGLVMDWCDWFGAQHGVVWTAPQRVVEMRRG